MKPETLSIHGGFASDSISGATAVPICQTVGLERASAAVSAVSTQSLCLTTRYNEKVKLKNETRNFVNSWRFCGR